MNGNTAPSLTVLAARRLNQISEGHFSAEVRTKASLCLIDALGAMHLGLAHELAGSMRTFALQNAARGVAYTCVSGEQVCSETAAFVNGTLIHW